MEEMVGAKNLWIKKVQRSVAPNLQAPVWDLVKDGRNILGCIGRSPGYNPVCAEGGLFGEKLTAHAHKQIMHQTKVRNGVQVQEGNQSIQTCKVFSPKPYASTKTAAVLSFWMEDG